MIHIAWLTFKLREEKKTKRVIVNYDEYIIHDNNDDNDNDGNNN